jgi:cyclophilin family peptidyl-prolyl cis-trans isomerase
MRHLPHAALVIMAAVGLVFGLSACDSSNEKTDSTATAPPTYKPTPPPPAPPAKPAVAAKPAPASTAPAAKPGNTQVVIDTNMGKIVVELDDNRVPATVTNFLKYVDDKFYDNTVIHRVEKNPHVIQGGGYDQALQQKPTRPPIVNEASKGRSNVRGTIAMARTQAPNSATCQFYINVGDETALDTYGGGYCAFGRVIEGMDVVDKIASIRTESRGEHASFPSETVVIQSIRRR